MTPRPREAAVPAGCGAAAIAAPGGPTAVPFRLCCALAIVQAADPARHLPSGTVVCGFGLLGFDDPSEAALVAEPS